MHIKLLFFGQKFTLSIKLAFWSSQNCQWNGSFKSINDAVCVWQNNLCSFQFGFGLSPRYGWVAHTMLLVTTRCMEKKHCTPITLLLAWALGTLRPCGLAPATWDSCAGRSWRTPAEVRGNTCTYRNTGVRLLGKAEPANIGLSSKVMLTSLTEDAWIKEEMFYHSAGSGRAQTPVILQSFRS